MHVTLWELYKNEMSVDREEMPGCLLLLPSAPLFQADSLISPYFVVVGEHKHTNKSKIHKVNALIPLVHVAQAEKRPIALKLH